MSLQSLGYRMNKEKKGVRFLAEAWSRLGSAQPPMEFERNIKQAVPSAVFVDELASPVINPVGPVVTICTSRFNFQQFYFLSTQYIYVFCVDL